MSYKNNLVIITNLYPLPWQPNRATFNKQQFELLKDNYNVSLLVPVAFPDWFKHRKEITQSENIRYVPYFYMPKIGRRVYSLSMFLSLLVHSGIWLKKKKAHSILASWAFPEAVAASLLSKLFGARFFFKVHGSDINLHGKIPARAKQIVKASEHASGILSVSKALANEMINMGIAKDKVNVIYNGVDHEKFGVSNERPKKEEYLLFVGNLKAEKGALELIQGFEKVSKDYPKLHLVYAGNGPMAQAIEHYAQQNKISERLTLLGNVKHELLPAWISHAKGLCLPSYNEGVPNVVLEAMACGTPVIATNVGGIPEVVEPYCGVIIQAKSSSEVSRGLTQLLEQQWSKEKIKAHAFQFNWQKNQRQFIQMLNKGIQK